jgi:ParB family chromosome partitioning protein
VAEKTRGMGRGLAAILATAPTREDGELRDVPVELISPNPAQPRRAFDKEGLVALAESLRTRGVLQPVLVRPVPGGRYQLVAGERRWRAARLAELETIPALVRPDDDADTLELALIENMAREDLNPVEEARACAALVEELGLTREDVGRRVGRSRVAVSNLIRLLDLPDEALELISAGVLSEGHGRALLLAPDHAQRRRLALEAAREGWSVRATEAQARGQAPDAGEQPRAARGPARVTLHPDHAEALERVGEELGAALGRDLAVGARGQGCRVELTFETVQEALDLAARLNGRAAA